MIDKKNRKIVIVRGVNNIRRYNIHDIKKMEILESLTGIEKTSTSSMLSRGIVGGALLGVVGGAIGANTANKHIDEEVKSIILKIYIVGRYNQKTIEISFFDQSGSFNSIDKSSDKYKSSIDKAKIWETTIQNIIDNYNNIDIEDITHVDPIDKEKSLVDELEKLASLKESGYITSDEFNKLKDKLIDTLN